MNTLIKIFHLTLRDNASQIPLLLLAMLGMAFFQTLGIASILPFISVLANPDLIFSNRHLFRVYELSELNDPNSFLLTLGLGTLIVLIVSNAISAFATKALIQFTSLQGHLLSKKLFYRYVNKPYIFFLQRNSSDLIKNIITEVHRCVNGVFTPVLDIISRSIIILFIIALLITMDPLLALIVLVVCGGAYILVYRITKQSLNRSGEHAKQSQAIRSKIVSETFGGIKELKLLGRDTSFMHLYERPSFEFAMNEAKSKLIAQLPKYALELIIFGGILLIMLYFLKVKENVHSVLPLLGLYAFAGYRLMPALQRIFEGLTTLRFFLPVVEMIHDDLGTYPSPHHKAIAAISPTLKTIKVTDLIALKDVTYSYPASSVTVINDLSLTIKANTTVGFVGDTGSGKTTLIDIILGLLPVDQGVLTIDEQLITSANLGEWQKNIGYVPQDIFLADDTVTSNIAFGIPDDGVNFDAVTKAAHIANIHNFISSDLSEGYETVLGERGVRLSGGQRQRIGIARALYHDPGVLILDEATSALDGITENIIMEAIHSLAHRKTIIMIAHRITTVRECDCIFLLEKGKIVHEGTYAELMESSEKFRNLARSSKASKQNV